MGNFDFLIENGEQDLYILANIAEKLYTQENYLSAGNIVRQFLESAICGFAENYGMEIERNQNSGDIGSLSSTIETLFDVYMNKNTFTKLKTTCDSLRWFGNNCSHYKRGRYDKEKSEVIEQLSNMHYVAKWYIAILYNSKEILNEKYNAPVISSLEQDYRELQSCYNNEIDNKKKIEYQLHSLQESYSNLKVNYDKLCENNLAIEELNNQYDDLEVLYNKTVSELHNATSKNNELHQEICNLKTSMEQLLAKFEKLNTRNEILERDNAELKAKVAQIDNNIPEIIKESTNELELNTELNIESNEEFDDVLNAIRLFNKKRIKYINFNTITHFLMGRYTNQISAFKLNLEEGYGKYKENGIRNLNNILLSIAELSIINYPLGDIEYLKDKDIFLLKEQNIVKTRLFTNYRDDNVEDLNAIESIYKENIYDYLFAHTINYLFEKYNDKCPVVVQKLSWTSNYYFIVDKIENDIAIGKIYNNGIFQKDEIFPANVQMFKLYDRLDLSKTIKPEILMEIYPPNLLDYTRLHTIEYLFNKYQHNGIIKVQRNGWNAGYYFLVERILGNLAYGKTKYGKENCYPANEATFSLYP